MKALKYLFLCITIFITALAGAFFYAPSTFATGFLRGISDFANASYTHANITFALMVFFGILSIFLTAFIVTEKRRRLLKKRRTLTKKFDEFGAKFEQEDKEIDF